MENYDDSKKTKHVHFISETDLSRLENKVNSFVDDNLNYKILGIRFSVIEYNIYVATITYLCNAFSDNGFWEED